VIAVGFGLFLFRLVFVVKTNVAHTGFQIDQ